MVHILGGSNSVFNQFIAEIRDKEIQKDSMRFRRNIERMGEIFAYEISKQLNYETKKVQTPLGVADVSMPSDHLVLATVLRAGLPLHRGIQNYFDKAENAFISAYREHKAGGEFEVHVEYLASPDITGKTLILADPMLATGTSMLLAYKAMLKRGIPAHIHLVSVVASKQAVEFIQEHMPSNTTIWLGVVDAELTSDSYIVPGIGDAGDLSFGEKI